jgi:hypothetical protein
MLYSHTISLTGLFETVAGHYVSKVVKICYESLCSKAKVYQLNLVTLGKFGQKKPRMLSVAKDIENIL